MSVSCAEGKKQLNDTVSEAILRSFFRCGACLEETFRDSENCFQMSFGKE